MDLQEITQRLEQIRFVSCHDDRAHVMEDALYRDFVREIAEGSTSFLKEKAVLILTSKDIDFERWYA